MTGKRDVTTGIEGKSLVGITGKINMTKHAQYTCEWNFTAEDQSTGEEITFSEPGPEQELLNQHLDGFDPIGDFDPSNLCSDSCGDRGISVSEGQMEDLATATDISN